MKHFRLLAFNALFFLLILALAPSLSLAQTDFGTYAVYSLAYSPDGSQIAVGGGTNFCSNAPADANNYAIRILDATTGQLIRNITGHTCAIDQLSWSPDGTKLVSVSEDGTARVWNATGGQISIYGSGPGVRLGGAAWSPDGQKIGSFLGNGAFTWDPNTMTILKRLDENDNSVITQLAWNPDSSKIALSTNKQNLGTSNPLNQVEIWDVTTTGTSGQLLRRFAINTVYAIAWSPDGTQLAGGGVDGTVKVFDPVSGQLAITLPGHAGGIASIAWNPEGTQIATAGADKAVRIWDAATGQQLTSFDYPGFVSAVAWSPDGQHIAFGGQNPDPDTLVQIVPVSLGTPSATATP